MHPKSSLIHYQVIMSLPTKFQFYLPRHPIPCVYYTDISSFSCQLYSTEIDGEIHEQRDNIQKEH